jgi:methylenetetrahydrofolate reductase (NADPH)
LRKASQIDVLPKLFHVEIPEDLATEMKKCTSDEQSEEVGIEWCTQQAKELKSYGVPSIHFYALNATQSVRRVAQNVY